MMVSLRNEYKFLFLEYFFPEMQISGNKNTTSEYNIRTLKITDGQYPSRLSGRQRKRLQTRQAF
jgi:hypothetical protein